MEEIVIGFRNIDMYIQYEILRYLETVSEQYKLVHIYYIVLQSTIFNELYLTVN